jgi:N-acetylmuramoyl-L-alanine amidase
MRNSTDATMIVRPSFQRLAARAFAEAITSYITGAR